MEFEYPGAVVFRAAAEAIPTMKGFLVSDVNNTARHLSVATKASAMSWGEKVTVSVTEVGPGRSALRIASAGKTNFGSATTHGKNRKNVEALIRATSNMLDRNGAEWATHYAAWKAEQPGAATPESQPASRAPEAVAAGQSIEERLRRLAALRDEGLITGEDFDARKQGILAEL